MSFSKNEGGYRRPFRIFPKIHPIWRSYPSLMYITAPRFRGMKYQGQCCHQLLPAVFSSVFIFRLDTLAVWWWKDYVLLSNGQIYKGKLDTRDLHKACVESLLKNYFSCSWKKSTKLIGPYICKIEVFTSTMDWTNLMCTSGFVVSSPKIATEAETMPLQYRQQHQQQHWYQYQQQNQHQYQYNYDINAQGQITKFGCKNSKSHKNCRHNNIKGQTFMMKPGSDWKVSGGRESRKESYRGLVRGK